MTRRHNRRHGQSDTGDEAGLPKAGSTWETPAVTVLSERIRSLPPEAVCASVGTKQNANEVIRVARRVVSELERGSGRGRRGWFARWQATQVIDAITSACPELTAEAAWQLESALEDAVSALVVRDLAPADMFDTLYGDFARVIPADELLQDPLAGLLRRCPYPLADISRQFENDVSPLAARVLFDRQRRTLEEIAGDLQVTRERIRQIESKAERIALRTLRSAAPELKEFWFDSLRSAARREEDLIEPFIDPSQALDSQRAVARSLLRALGATEPMPFREWGLVGWWTLHPDSLMSIATELEALLPCSAEQMDDTLAEFALGESSALGELVRHHWGQFHYDAITDSWVRSSARVRDAAWLILLAEDRPLEIHELSDRTGAAPRALGAQLARDERFRQLKPSGHWTLGGAQSQESPYSTTLEACVDILQTQGPLTMRELVARVQASHSVSVAAVHQCLNYHAIGRLPDGRLDLVARGAIRRRRHEPRLSSDLFVRDGKITLLRLVDHDLLRGSGLGVSPYLTWFLGLESAPSARTFEISGYAPLKVRYSVNGSSISSLKTLAEELRAQDGCVLALTMDPSTDRATIALRCRQHSHAGSLP